jgi:hypothetical protein
VAIANTLKYSNNTLCSLSLLNNLIFQDGMAAIRSALLDSYTPSSSDSSAGSSFPDGTIPLLLPSSDSLSLSLFLTLSDSDRAGSNPDYEPYADPIGSRADGCAIQ